VRSIRAALILLFLCAVVHPPEACAVGQREDRDATNNADTQKKEIVRLTTEALRLHTIDAGAGLRLGQQALLLAEQEGDTLLQIRAHNAVGANRWIRGEYGIAAKEHMRALELAEAIRSPHDMGVSMNNMGLLCRNIGMTDRAESYLREAVRLRRDLSDRTGLTRSLMNLGLLLFETGRFDSSRIIHEQSLRLAVESGDTLNRARNLHYLGRIERKRGRLPEALALVEEALVLFERIRDRNGLTLALSDRAALLLKSGRTEMAMNAASVAMKEALTLDSPFAIREAAGALSRANAAMGDFKKAFEYQTISREMDDSLKVLQTSYQFAQMTVEREIAAKERLWAFRETQRQLEWEAARRSDAIVRNTLIAGTFLLGIIVVALVAAYRIKRKSALLIAVQKEQIEEANRELALEIDTRERMLRIIGHDLIGPLGNISGMIELVSDDSSGVSDDDRAELLEAALQTSRASTALLGRLLDWAHAQKKNLVFSPVEGDLMQLVHSVLSLLAPQANLKKVRLEVSGPSRLLLSFDPHLVTVILENLLSNAVKFTPECGRIDLDIMLEDGRCIIRVTDTGKGIRNEIVERIREGRPVASEPGSAMEVGHGLGLELCHRLIQLHRGRFDVKSTEGKGSTFTVEIPIQIDEL
jgi:signal transduction histidine kinase